METSNFSEEELEVANILSDLPHLYFLNQKSYSPPLISNWGFKKRRTAIDQDDDHHHHSLKLKPPELNSPSTPLYFAQSEDRKSKRSRRKTKEQWLEFIDELTQVKEQLAKEVNNVRAYYEKILIENSNLKAKQKELNKSRVENREKRVVKIVRLKKHMYPTQVLAEKASGPFNCPDLNSSDDGPGPIGSSMGSYERNGVEEDNKDEEAAETGRRRVVKLKLEKSRRD